jgi:ABC-type lipoprotein release transport system permease subunit
MFWKIVLNQALHRWGITLLIFLAMVSLVSLYVYLLNTSRFTNRSIQLIMKQMGHNMLILPEQADRFDTYLCTDAQVFFPDQVTHRLAQSTQLFSRYYVSVLQQRITVGGTDCLLTGIEPVERVDETREKGNMVRPLSPANARLGAEVAKRLRLQVGDEVRVLDRVFEVSQVVEPQGTEQDFRLFVPLRECQEMLGQSGNINVIWAFECLHHGGPLHEIEELQAAMLAEVQPGFKHVSIMPIARGRFLTRQNTTQTLRYLLGIVCAATVLIIAINGVHEVAERRREVGILSAMGVSFPRILALYFTKVFVLAVAASVTGFLTGSLLAVHITSDFLVTHTQNVAVLWHDLPSVTLLTCAVAAVAMALPMVQLLRMDPNATLIEE